MERVTVEEILRRRIGLDPASTGPGLVTRSTRARMKALGMDDADVETYQALVNRSSREFDALVEEVVVPESWFFRDEQPFILLTDRAAAGWVADPSRPPLRALSLPCAAGQEPYSIAMALSDLGLPPNRFHVDAVDVSHAVLTAAGRAVYGANAFRSSDLSFRDRHFRQTTAGYELSADIKSSVHFHHGNLLDPRLLADRPPYDMIFCRNLLIYLDEAARKLAAQNLDRLLSPTGVLFVGHAEQLGFLSRRFRRTSDRRCFAFERLPSTADVEPSPPAVSRPRALTSKKPHSNRPAAVTPKPVPQVPRLPKAEVAVDILGEASRLADLGRHASAAELCERAIREKGPTAPAFYLLGVVSQATGERDRAERCFEKAVYLDPGHHEALLNLSLIAQRRGDLAAAAGYRRRAERASGEKPT